MNNIINQIAFIRTSREFPTDLHQLAQEVNKCYVDIAQALNTRTVGFYPINTPALTGNNYFLNNNQSYLSFRQLFQFGAIAAGATLNIDYGNISFTQFVAIYGTCITDQPDMRPIPYASVVANANIDIRIDTAAGNIVIAVGAASPNIISGLVIIEWITNP